MKYRYLSYLLAVASFCAPAGVSAIAQTAAPSQSVTCDGTASTIRVSAIKPGKTNDFLAAVAAQLAWYRSKGITNNQIYVSKIMVQDPSTNVYTYSDTEFMTFHVNPPPHNSKLNRDDDGYKAFVKLFRDSSDIRTEYQTCGPKM